MAPAAPLRDRLILTAMLVLVGAGGMTVASRLLVAQEGPTQGYCCSGAGQCVLSDEDACEDLLMPDDSECDAICEGDHTGGGPGGGTPSGGSGCVTDAFCDKDTVGGGCQLVDNPCGPGEGQFCSPDYGSCTTQNCQAMCCKCIFIGASSEAASVASSSDGPVDCPAPYDCDVAMGAGGGGTCGYRQFCPAGQHPEAGGTCKELCAPAFDTSNFSLMDGECFRCVPDGASSSAASTSAASSLTGSSQSSAQCSGQCTQSQNDQCQQQHKGCVGLDLAPCFRCSGSCGNHRAEPGEECDDGNTEDGDGCASDCTLEPTCGGGSSAPSSAASSAQSSASGGNWCCRRDAGNSVAICYQSPTTCHDGSAPTTQSQCQTSCVVSSQGGGSSEAASVAAAEQCQAGCSLPPIDCPAGSIQICDASVCGSEDGTSCCRCRAGPICDWLIDPVTGEACGCYGKVCNTATTE